MAAGDFSASALLQIRAKAEQIWNDGVKKADYIPQAEAAKAVLANQTASFTEIQNPEKDNSIKVTFINACGIVDEACDETCEITAPELETGSKVYEMDLCRTAKFSVDRNKFRTNDYNPSDVVARGLAAAVKTLDEWWDKQVILKLKAFAGVNLFPAPYTYAAGTTSVPAADYNNKMIAYLIEQAVRNRISGYYMIENGQLYNEWLNAMFNAGNADDKGNAERMKAIKLYFDLFGFAATGITEDLFLLSGSAVAMKTKNRYTSTPQVIGGKVQETVYTIPSIALAGVSYDVTYQTVCKIVGGEKHIVDAWDVRTRGGIFLNPEACNGTNGVLSYSRV